MIFSLRLGEMRCLILPGDIASMSTIFSCELTLVFYNLVFYDTKLCTSLNHYKGQHT